MTTSQRVRSILDTVAVTGGPPLLFLALVALVGAAGPARAHEPETALALVDGACEGGDPISPTQVITGSFPHALQGSYVMVPFEVPPGTTSVRVKYCWDRPEGPTPGNSGHTIDLGLWQTRPAGGELGRGAVPRLGRLEPPRRDHHAAGLLERGGVPREPEGPRRRPHDARLPAGPDPGRRVGGGARRRGGGAGGGGRRRRHGRVAARDRAVERSGVRRRAATCRRATTAPRCAAAPTGTRATCTSTPSTPRSATRP